MKRAAAICTFSLLAAIATLVETASARSRSSMGGSGVVLPRSGGVPLMAVISLNDQRITVYDAQGKILQAPVSTGRREYETPAGVYSILEKNREHYSNLYDDAAMPFMQRITWSGIALHAGDLPGYPASHGCIRLPHSVAEELFELTKIGMRVVVVRDDMHPVEIAHPALFKPGAIRSELGLVSSASEPSQVVPAATGSSRNQTWRSIANIKLARAQAAARAEEEASNVAAKAKSDAARLSNNVTRAEGARARAEVQLKHAERTLAEHDRPGQWRTRTAPRSDHRCFGDSERSGTPPQPKLSLRSTLRGGPIGLVLQARSVCPERTKIAGAKRAGAVFVTASEASCSPRPHVELDVLSALRSETRWYDHTR